MSGLCVDCGCGTPSLRFFAASRGVVLMFPALDVPLSR
jgi:hypothetical protein